MLYGWRDKYAEYLEDPRVILQNDRLILAGRMRELGGAVASFQFRPHLDAGRQTAARPRARDRRQAAAAGRRRG